MVHVVFRIAVVNLAYAVEDSIYRAVIAVAFGPIDKSEVRKGSTDLQVLDRLPCETEVNSSSIAGWHKEALPVAHVYQTVRIESCGPVVACEAVVNLPGVLAVHVLIQISHVNRTGYRHTQVAVQMPLLGVGVDIEVFGVHAAVNLSQKQFHLTTDRPLVAQFVAVTGADLGIGCCIDAESRKSDSVYAACQVLHTAAKQEIEHRFRQRSTGLDLLVDAYHQIAVLFDTEAHIDETERHVAVEIGHVPHLVQEGYLVAVRVERGDCLAGCRINVENIAHGQRVVSYAERRPTQRREVDESLAHGLEGRVDGMAHRCVLQEIECRHLLCACVQRA